jgi:hypothetical protein
VDLSQVTQLLGPGRHRFPVRTRPVFTAQGSPMLEERQACFFNYHDPARVFANRKTSITIVTIR